MEIGNGKQVAQKGKEMAVPLQKEKENHGNAPRQVIDKDHEGTMVRDYWKYFADFSKGKKQEVKQLIPGKVWKKIYADYKVKHPGSAFMEESLKAHLRASIKDLNSGVKNPEEFEGTTLQDDKVMEILMSTDEWKACNLLRTRSDAAQGTSGPERNSGENIQPIASGQLSSHAEGSPPTPSGQTDKPVLRPTKSQTLKRAAGELISEILSEVKRLKGVRTHEFEAKWRLAEAQTALSHARREEFEARLRFQQQQNILGHIKLLEKQRELGLLTEEEFTENCKVVFGS